MIAKLSLYVVLGGLTLLFQLGLGRPLSELVFAREWEASHLLIDVFLGIATGFVVVWLSRVASRALDWVDDINEEFRDVLGPLSSTDIFWLALMSSVAEELFFRGFLQGWLGIHLSSIIFGLAHFPYRRRLIPWTVAAVIMGYVFGALFEGRQCLIAAVLAHFVINYFNLHYITAIRADEPTEGPPWNQWIGLDISAARQKNGGSAGPVQHTSSLDE